MDDKVKREEMKRGSRSSTTRLRAYLQLEVSKICSSDLQRIELLGHDQRVRFSSTLLHASRFVDQGKEKSDSS